MSPALLDSHCHLALETAAETIAAARAEGVDRFITVGCDRASSEQALAVAAAHDGVWATVGLHPHDAKDGVAPIVDLFDAPGVLAVGECGLDYHYDHSPRAVQRQAFAEQIAIAHERDLPLVIHTREAWDDTFATLASEGAPRRTVFHCFTGGPAEAERCLELGAFLSFSGIVTFPSATDVQAAAVLCPADRLLVETDSPYLAPVPLRGRRNQPAYLPHVVRQIATLRGELPESVVASSWSAAKIAFSVTDS
jgi:TatD DNase family protein